MRTSRKLPALLIAFLASCGNGKAQTSEQQGETKATAPGVAATGTAAFPADTRVVMSAAVPKLAASPLARHILSDLLGRDADAKGRLVALFVHCKIDPEKDLDSVTIGMSQGSDIALLVRGRLDEKALVDCTKAETVSGGGSFSDKTIAGQTVHAATSKEGGQNVFFTFLPDKTVVVALSEPWLAKVLDAKAPKIDTAPELAALLGRVPRDAAVWGTGLLPPGVGQNLVKLTDGQVTQPAQSVAFDATFDAGLSATLRIDMKGATDAEKLAAFSKGQLDWLAVAAQRYSVGPLVSKIQITSEQSSVKFSARLDDADIKTIETALAKNAAPDKPEKPEKKEQSK